MSAGILTKEFNIAIQRFCYRGPKPQKCPKWLGEVFCAKGTKVLFLVLVQKSLLRRCKTGFWWCQRLLGDLCSLGPKHLLHCEVHAPLEGPKTKNNYPLSQNDYRQEKIIFELFSGALQENPVIALGAITGGALTEQGPIQETIFLGILFGGSTGKSCNSPGAITWKNVYRIILVIISP